MSGKPAARITDSTAHGGQICTGDPTVLIGNKPAARVTDEHNCRPGHGNGPILPPCAVNVLIGNKPAARVGDKHSCRCGHEDPIVTGDPTVLIGDTGGSGAGLAAAALLGEVLGRAVKAEESEESKTQRKRGEGSSDGETDGGETSKGTNNAKYKSQDDAAKAALTSVNPTSIAENREYGGLIYKDDATGKFGYTEPVAGGVMGFNPDSVTVPDGTTQVGDFHTHGDYSTMDFMGNLVRTSDPSRDVLNCDNFSMLDQMGIGHDGAGRPGYAGYLGTPSGKLKKFVPATGEISDF
jgi:uncharacterized Zn-binding protein involved in type VI secretion